MLRREFDLVFSGSDPLLPYANECPVRYEVWLAYAMDDEPGRRHDVMLNAFDGVEPGDIAQRLVGLLGPAATGPARLAISGEFIVVQLTLKELILHVVPLTTLQPLLAGVQAALSRPQIIAAMAEQRSQRTAFPPVEADQSNRRRRATEGWDRLSWFARLLLATYLRSFEVLPSAAAATLAQLLEPLPPPGGLLTESELLSLVTEDPREPLVDSVTINRRASSTVRESRKTVKADAAGSLFEVDCSSLTWAVLDSGIDAFHPAFRVRNPDGSAMPPDPATGTVQSRVTATYDFTELRQRLAGYQLTRPDWKQLESELRVPHTPAGAARYKPPTNEHGTHVAGVLGGHWPEENLRGLCPDIRLWDIRVLEKDGTGLEFNIIAALQFLRWVNERSARPAIVGANLSFALPHKVANFSCGWTPVCVECDRLVRAGVVVVTVAGNAAFDDGAGSGYADGTSYRAISITDPGNADAVITVGATHRTDPFRHGVSFFSGRGPTADGRLKPDLLAPGERIDGPVPDEGIRRMTGTSQAAPHVSGAAAMLLARYRELLGRPDRVKQVLCSSATDLGRAQTFQGHGLLDVLRAMQSL
jgi:hypothetical protein